MTALKFSAKRIRRLLFSSVLSSAWVMVVFAGCEDLPKVVSPAIRIVATPSTLALEVGQSQKIVATVTNAGTSTGVTFESLVPQVATVDANGLVVGVSPGRGSIKVASVADPSVHVIVIVDVVAASTQASVTSIVDPATNQAVNPANVAGTIVVNQAFRFAAGQQGTLETRVDNAVVCGKAVTGTGSVVAETCSISTASLNPATGAASFLNGPHTVDVRLVNSTGATVATSTPQSLTFANPNGLAVIASSTKSTTVGGLLWHTGDLSVIAVPAIYDSNAQFGGTVTFTSQIGGVNSSQPGVRNNNGAFIASYTQSAQLKDYEGQLAINVQSTLANGTAGPSKQITENVDNRAPTAAGFTITNAWLNSLSVLGPPDLIVNSPFDGGSGLEAYRYEWAFANSATYALLTGIRELPQDPIASALQMRVWLSDRVGNATTVPGNRLVRADFTTPILGLAPGSIADGTINPAPGSDFILDLTDAHSGPNGLNVSLELFAPNITGPARCPIGTLDAATNRCAPVLFQTNRFPFFPAAAYEVFSAVGRDVAGNSSAPITVSLLNDRVAPALTNATLPAGGPFGGQGVFTVTAQATDNLDLSSLAVWQCFNFGTSSGCIPRTSRISVGAFGAQEFTTSVNTPLNFNTFARSMELTSTTGAPAGTTYPANQITTEVKDQAGNAAFLNSPLTIDRIAPALGSFSTRGVNSFVVNALPPFVCNRLASAAPCPAGGSHTAQVTASVTGASNFQNPFERVILYYTDGQGFVRMAGEATQATVVDANGQRSHQFTVTFDATGLPAQAAVNMIAAGISADGHSLNSRSVQTSIVNGR